MALLVPTNDAAHAADTRPPSFLVIVLDTLNPTRLGCYGGPATPTLDSLATTGMLFLDTWCEAPVTAPSVATLLTSRGIADHGVHANRRSFDHSSKRLPSYLLELGFRTGAFVSNGEIDRGAGFFWGFQRFDDDLTEPEANRPHILERRAEDTVRVADRWLAEGKGTPFLCLVHLNDAHGPYDSGEPVPGDPGGRILPVSADNFPRGAIPAYQAMGRGRTVNQYIAAYDGEIRALDRAVGSLMAGLRERSQDRETLVILTGDHGESFGAQNRYFQHGSALTEEQLRVPLLMTGPGVSPGVSSAPTLVADIMPTVLGRLGIQVPGLLGRDLFQLADTGAPPPAWDDRWRHALLAPADPNTGHLPRSWTQAIRLGSWKMVRRRDGTHTALYDLDADPTESRNLFGMPRFATAAATLDSLLLEWEIRHPLGEASPIPRPLTERGRSSLTATGYLN